jgi:hypothetical protein
MGSLLLHNAWVRLYLLYVGALGTYFIWDRLRTPRPSQTDPSPARRHMGIAGRTQPKEAVHGGASRSPLHR